MNEHDLARALAGASASIQPAGDPGRLHAGMIRHDRVRRIRTVGAASALGVVAALGVFAALPRDASTPVDVTDQPTESPESGSPDLEPIGIDDASAESSTTTLPSFAGEPSHLAAPTPTSAAPPAAVVTTTLPPTTTAAPAPASTTTTTTSPAGFTASARYGSCEEDPPYDEYTGVASPGATVTITSPWSAPTSVVAAGNGSWFLRVEFPSAPVGIPFVVTADDGTSSMGLDFVRTA